MTIPHLSKLLDQLRAVEMAGCMPAAAMAAVQKAILRIERKIVKLSAAA